MDLRLVSTPLTRAQKVAAVGFDETKAQARVTSNDEDDLIASDIEAAYDFLAGPEGWLGRCCLLKEDWEFYPGSRLGGAFEIPMRPLFGDITSFEVLDSTGGTYGAVATTVYTVQRSSLFATVQRGTFSVWPWAGYLTPDALAYRVRFSAGFGDVPSPIKKSIQMLVAYWRLQRETIGMDGRAVGEDVQYGLKALCGRYRVSPDHS